MQMTDIENSLADLFSAVLEHPVSRNWSRHEDGAWDSLKHIQLVFAVESTFGVRFDEETIAGLDSFQAFLDYVVKHRAAQSGN
mgnify:CR=1 FL=1